MATKKKETESVAVTAEFSKSAILESQKYADDRDLIKALLSDERSYTTEDIDKKIKEYKTKEVE